MPKIFGFSPEFRLRNKSDFDRVFKNRKKLFNKHFIVYFRPNDLKNARVGIIAAKRNVKLAVARNRIRRAIKEQFRANQQSFPAFDIVVIVQNTAGTATKIELQQCLANLFRRLANSP